MHFVTDRFKNTPRHFLPLLPFSITSLNCTVHLAVPSVFQSYFGLNFSDQTFLSLFIRILLRCMFFFHQSGNCMFIESVLPFICYMFQFFIIMNNKFNKSKGAWDGIEEWEKWIKILHLLLLYIKSQSRMSLLLAIINFMEFLLLLKHSIKLLG